MERWLNVAVKAVLIGLLLVAVLLPDLGGFQGKGMGPRAAAYPLALLVVPAIWLLRGRRQPYPHAVDVLVALPFLIRAGARGGAGARARPRLRSALDNVFVNRNRPSVAATT